MTNRWTSLRGGQRTSLSYDELRTAIDQGGLALHYQPIVDLATEALMGFEALVRLPHPALGLIPAATFVPLAERWGLIRALDEWVLWAACEQLAAWQADMLVTSEFYVAINVSGSEVDGCSLGPRMARAIAGTGIDPTGIVIEFTESQPFEHHTSLRSAAALHDLGVGIALDDFGVSFATFSRLRSLAFDVVKIDRSITSLVSTELGAQLMRTIVTECHDLGATIVAEGIETAEQARLALVLGCDLGQGYLWAPALPVHKAELLLSAPRPTTAWGAASDSPPALSSSISS